MVRTAGYGATFVSALSLSLISFVCYAFVVDTDLVHTRPGNDHNGSDLIPEMHKRLSITEKADFVLLAVPLYLPKATGIWSISSGRMALGSTARQLTDRATSL